MIRTKVTVLVLVTAVLTAGALVFGSVAAQGKQKTPKRVLIVLFDQMLPEYANQFDMPNFRRLRDAGTNFRNAYLGYMASETVIATTSSCRASCPSTWAGPMRRTVTPKRLARARELDAHHGRPVAGRLQTLINHEGYPKLPDYLPPRTRARSSSWSARSPTRWSRRSRRRRSPGRHRGAVVESPARG